MVKNDSGDSAYNTLSRILKIMPTTFVYDFLNKVGNKKLFSLFSGNNPNDVLAQILRRDDPARNIIILDKLEQAAHKQNTLLPFRDQRVEKLLQDVARYRKPENSSQQAIINQLIKTMQYAQDHSATSAWNIYSLFSTRGTTSKKAIAESINVLYKTDNVKDAVGVVTTLFNLLRNNKTSFKSNSFEYIFIQQLSAIGKPAGGLRGSFARLFSTGRARDGVNKGLLTLSTDELNNFKSYEVLDKNAVPDLSSGGPAVREEYMKKTLAKLNDIAAGLTPHPRNDPALR
jgi:hypothetical protein